MTLSVRKMAAALGVSKSQVNRDALAGMPMDTVEAAQAWRLRNHDMSRTVEGRIDRPPAPPVAATPIVLPPAPEDDLDAPPPEGDTAEYRQNRAQRERIRKEREQLELDKLRGSLVDREEVARLRFTEFRALRDSLGNLGTRLKDQLAAETDSLKCEALVNDELDAVLAAFADQVLTRGVTQDEDDGAD